MNDYQPPVPDMMFLLMDVLGFSHDGLDRETVQAILDEAAKLAGGVLGPLNRPGDQKGAQLKGEEVITAPGFKDAYKEYYEGGWNAVPFDDAYGGQGLPWGLAFAIQEMWQGANMSFGLCPLLNQGAVDAIALHGSQAQKDTYLPRLIEGSWTGTMNLTEPQAGSDLGLLRAKAERQQEGHYKISGQKIYITYGEHDMAENIIHLVLARTPDAPDDVKGISLFIVPKILEDGTRNAVKCIGLEHKLGIHASPTCTMEFDNATGYLIGEEHAGLKYMFTMMNNARLSVGLQGVAIAEAAYQAAAHYAQDRVQGKSLTTGERIAIAGHPDVRRMLLTMKSSVEAGRALTYQAAMALNAAQHGDTKAQQTVDVLTPIVKAWCTDMAVEVASIAVQVCGGMGYIEETGVAQYYRDARILPIYEGTNGIQAFDLVFRKLLRDEGAAVTAYLRDMKEMIAALPDEQQDFFAAPIAALDQAQAFLLVQYRDKNTENCAAAAAPFLKGFGILAGGVLLARSAEEAKTHPDPDFAAGKQKTAAFYNGNILPFAASHLEIVCAGYIAEAI